MVNSDGNGRFYCASARWLVDSSFHRALDPLDLNLYFDLHIQDAEIVYPHFR